MTGTLPLPTLPAGFARGEIPPCRPLASILARSAALLIQAVLVSTLTLAPGHASADGGTLKFVPHASLRVLDPVWTTAYISRNHGYMIYDTLFAMDRDYKPRPQMVDTYFVSADGLKYTFTLRQGLKWHDGAPVRARDCVASIKRWGARDPLGIKLMGFTRSLEAESDSTFSLTLKEPFGLVLEALAKPSGAPAFMMPERVALTDPQKQIEDYTGSGPYRFVKEEFQPGAKAVYAPFAGYVPRSEPPNSLSGGKRVYLDRVEWIYIPDHNTAVAALNAGEVDLLEDPPVDLFPLLRANPKITIQVTDTLGFQQALRFNHLQPPFNNPKARRALLYAIKQEDVMRAVVGDPQYFRSCAAIFLCNGPAPTSAGAEDVHQDLDRAKALLAEAGYHGESIVIMDPTDLNVLHSATSVVVPMLRKAGLTVEVQSMDWSTLLTRRTDKRPSAQGGWNLFITAGSGADLISPLAHFHINPLCEKGGPGWYCDVTMQELQDRWSRTTDPARAKALLVDIQKEAYAAGAYVPLGEYQQPIAYRGISGVVPAPVPVLWNIRKD